MKVKELIQILKKMNQEKLVVQEAEEWCDVGFSLQTYNLTPTKSVDETDSYVILRRIYYSK